MERKVIENMVECCKNTFYCSKCQCDELCITVIDLLETSEIFSSVPCSWNDEDIDNILNVINKEG